MHYCVPKTNKQLSLGKMWFREALFQRLFLLCGPGWLGIHYLGPGKPRICDDSPASASEVLRFRVCSHRLGLPGSLLSGVTSPQEPLPAPSSHLLRFTLHDYSLSWSALLWPHFSTECSLCSPGVCRMWHRADLKAHKPVTLEVSLGV